MSKERWLPIKGYEGRYEISDHGRVKALYLQIQCRGRNNSIRNTSFPERIMKQHTGSKNDYLQVGLSNNRIVKHRLVHRIVAMHFLSNLKNKEEVNHIDGNPRNNHYTNLEWVSRKENVAHAYRTGLVVNHSGLNPYANSVIIDNGIEVKSFPTQREAARYMGVKEGTLCASKLNNRKLKGYKIINNG
jgi:hypothetical protein